MLSKKKNGIIVHLVRHNKVIPSYKPEHIRRPDISFRILRFREDHIVKGISCNDFPSYRLLKRTSQELDDLFNGPIADIKSADVLGKDTGESGRQVQRFIRLTNLIPELLDMVDQKQISFNPAVELSYPEKG
mgnify:CR=1 FL=1